MKEANGYSDQYQREAFKPRLEGHSWTRKGICKDLEVGRI